MSHWRKSPRDKKLKTKKIKTTIMTLHLWVHLNFLKFASKEVLFDRKTLKTSFWKISQNTLRTLTKKLRWQRSPKEWIGLQKTRSVKSFGRTSKRQKALKKKRPIWKVQVLPRKSKYFTWESDIHQSMKILFCQSFSSGRFFIAETGK